MERRREKGTESETIREKYANFLLPSLPFHLHPLSIFRGENFCFSNPLQLCVLYNPIQCIFTFAMHTGNLLLFIFSLSLLLSLIIIVFSLNLPFGTPHILFTFFIIFNDAFLPKLSTQVDFYYLPFLNFL